MLHMYLFEVQTVLWNFRECEANKNSEQEYFQQQLTETQTGKLPAVPQRSAHLTFAVLQAFPFKKAQEKVVVPRNPTVSKREITHTSCCRTSDIQRDLLNRIAK